MPQYQNNLIWVYMEVTGFVADCDRIIEIARRYFPAKTGVNIDGFAGRFLS